MDIYVFDMVRDVPRLKHLGLIHETGIDITEFEGRAIWGKVRWFLKKEFRQILRCRPHGATLPIPTETVTVGGSLVIIRRHIDFGDL